MKNKKTYYVLLAILGSLFVILMILQALADAQTPEPIDRGDSFSRNDKIMYGSFAVYEMLDNIFEEFYIQEVKKTASQQMLEALIFDDEDSLLNIYYNYIFINNDLRDLNLSDVDEFLWFAESGNYIFMSARIFPDDLIGTLKFNVQSEFFVDLESEDLDSVLNELQKPHTFEQINLQDYFSYYDEEITEVLEVNDEGRPNLIKIKHGDGAFILSTVPNMFTNYNLLHTQNHDYISRSFSHLPPDNQVWWDEYYKARYLAQMKLAQSPLQYIFSQESLKWAYWLIVYAIILYAIFEAKRSQRIVPIIKPLANATLEFTETIGRLYHQSGDHKNIADKKVKILLAQIRRRYFLKTHLFTDDFMKNLAAKSGVDKNFILELCRMVDGIRRREIVTENELIELSAKIEEFYELSRR